MKANTNTNGSAAKAAFITLKNNLNLIIALVALAFSACANDRCDQRQQRYCPPQPFYNGGQGQFIRGGNNGSGTNRILAFDIHVDHQSRPISEPERQAFFRGMWDRGASQEETEQAFRERFASPNATFVFRNGWSPRGGASSGDRGPRGVHQESSSSDEPIQLDKDGFPVNGGAVRTNYRRVTPADEELVSAHASNNRYRQPTQSERDDTAFWADMPEGAGTGQYHYPPSTLEKSRKVRAQADRDEARFSRD